MTDSYEMLKAVVLAGRDEGYMEAGDNISATGEILVIFSGFDQSYDDETDDYLDDENNEIYEIYINKKALIKDFEYEDQESFLDIESTVKGQIHIRAVYEVDQDILHMNELEEYIGDTEEINLADVSKLIKLAYKNISDE